MIREIRKHAELFLNGKTDKGAFVAECKKLYSIVVSNYTKSIDIKNIIVIPYIHEFAYWSCGEAELKKEVRELILILDGSKSHFYSTFFKLAFPKEVDKKEYDLYLNFNNIKFGMLYDIFNNQIENVVTLKDVLHNCIFDILEGIGCDDNTECCFNQVNYSEVSFPWIKEKVILLLSYYLGINSFFLQINVSSGNAICAIL